MLKGVVLYGYDLDIIVVRVVKYIYGVGINICFIKDKYFELKKKFINGIEYCIDKFDIYVNKGIFVYFNEEMLELYFLFYED